MGNDLTIPKVKTWKDYVLLALAAGVPSNSIAAELAQTWNISRTSRAIRQIRNRNPDKVAEARTRLDDYEPYFDRIARIVLRARRIRHLEGLADSAGNEEYVKIEEAINRLADSIGKETGDIQSGSRQTNITNVHQGPEESWRTVDKGYRERRLKDA